jgi:hypothetical protein
LFSGSSPKNFHLEIIEGLASAEFLDGSLDRFLDGSLDGFLDE